MRDFRVEVVSDTSGSLENEGLHLTNRRVQQRTTTMDKQFEKSILFCAQTLIY